jgi:UDP-N-acetylglucosamine--N-acetylmuramyl-(pentapeptide) pyrophosphoryl-undecaprenol N-acetylglucosamine transferase
MPNLIKNKIILTGGGTGGSVTPLLAVADELGYEDFEYLWLGTRRGPEKTMLAKEQIAFKPIIATKLRRYFSLKTLFAPLFFACAFIQSFFIILKFRPAWILTSGSFVSVPVVWAGWLLGTKILVHQQDVMPGLANKLMAPFAKVITVTFKKSLEDYGKKARWVGNPIRVRKLIAADKSIFNLKKGLPVVFIFGGGTGAEFLNQLVVDALPALTKFCQVIHLTGKGKQLPLGTNFANYYPYDFFSYDKMLAAYQAADIVVARAGLATITELSYFGKPSIIIAMPRTHQVANATLLESETAALVLDQPILEPEFFVKEIRELLADKARQKEYGDNIKKIIKPEAARAIAQLINVG